MSRTLFRICTLAVSLLFSVGMFAQLPRPHLPLNHDHPVAAIDTAAATTAVYGGNLNFSLTVTVKSTLPVGSTVYCSASASVLDLGTGRTYVETAVAQAAANTGTTSCIVRIPYSWTLDSTMAATDSITLDYSVFAVPPSTISPTAVAERSSSSTLGSITVPANGTVTVERANVVI